MVTNILKFPEDSYLSILVLKYKDLNYKTRPIFMFSPWFLDS